MLSRLFFVQLALGSKVSGAWSDARLVCSKFILFCPAPVFSCPTTPFPLFPPPVSLAPTWRDILNCRPECERDARFPTVNFMSRLTLRQLSYANRTINTSLLFLSNPFALFPPSKDGNTFWPRRPFSGTGACAGRLDHPAH